MANLPADKSISERLTDIGIRHERDEYSTSTGEHRLYVGDAFLGHYTANGACKLLRLAEDAA